MKKRAAFASSLFGSLASFAVSIALPASAHAQTVIALPSPGLPQTLVIPTGTGDASRSTAGLPLDLAMMPLRLSLTSVSWASAGAMIPDCTQHAEQSGNTQSYLPQNRAAAIHLVPNLTLVGFSTTSCLVDATAGAGLVYTAPIRKDMWLVAGVGGAVFIIASDNNYVVTLFDVELWLKSLVHFLFIW